jgi:hypothetical protein
MMARISGVMAGVGNAFKVWFRVVVTGEDGERLSPESEELRIFVARMAREHEGRMKLALSRVGVGLVESLLPEVHVKLLSRESVIGLVFYRVSYPGGYEDLSVRMGEELRKEFGGS